MNKTCITCSKDFEGSRKQLFCPGCRTEKKAPNLPEKIFEVEKKNILIEEKVPLTEEKVILTENKVDGKPKDVQKNSSHLSDFRRELMKKRCKI